MEMLLGSENWYLRKACRLLAYFRAGSRSIGEMSHLDAVDTLVSPKV